MAMKASKMFMHISNGIYELYYGTAWYQWARIKSCYLKRRLFITMFRHGECLKNILALDYDLLNVLIKIYF
jgi:hypothetical protein